MPFGIGHDELFGREGRDYLLGGDGRDLLDGGDDGARDELLGGEGNDIFIRHKQYRISDDSDKFTDFDTGERDESFNDGSAPITEMISL